MATSGSANLDFDIIDIIEEAYEQAGSEVRGGNDIRTARRSLNLLLMEWANLSINLWSLQGSTLAITAGVSDYSLPEGTVDLIEHYIRTTSGTQTVDFPLNRISVSTYSQISQKSTTGRPLQILINRTSAPSIKLWPVPDVAYTLYYWRLRRLDDVTTNGTNTADVPFRFLPALIAGLAYNIALKKRDLTERVPLLKQRYDEILAAAMAEDQERASWFIAPDIVG